MAEEVIIWSANQSDSSDLSDLIYCANSFLLYSTSKRSA